MSDNRCDESAPAAAYVQAWARAGEALEAQELAELRALTERESARQFAELLSPASGSTIALRKTSGLVEQQRILRSIVNPK